MLRHWGNDVIMTWLWYDISVKNAVLVANRGLASNAFMVHFEGRPQSDPYSIRECEFNHAWNHCSRNSSAMKCFQGVISIKYRNWLCDLLSTPHHSGITTLTNLLLLLACEGDMAVATHCSPVCAITDGVAECTQGHTPKVTSPPPFSSCHPADDNNLPGSYGTQQDRVVGWHHLIYYATNSYAVKVATSSEVHARTCRCWAGALPAFLPLLCMIQSAGGGDEWYQTEAK